jgi:hypothetical protein
MKKISLMYCLLAFGILVIGCDPKTSTPMINLSSNQICDPSAKDKTACLTLDADHAVLLSLRDGKAQLKGLPADSLQYGRGRGLEGLKTSLLRGQKGHRFTPKSTQLLVEQGDLVFKSGGNEDFRITSTAVKGGFFLLLNDGESVIISAYSGAEAAPGTCEQPVDITSKVTAGACTRITVGDKICLTSLGVIEILDNAIDPDLYVRIKVDINFLDHVIQGDPDIIRNPGNWMELRHKNFQMPTMAKPQASAAHMPLHLAGNPVATPTSDGTKCGSIATYESTQTLCSMRIGAKKILYCNHALYSADDASGANKTLILSLNQQGCDLCFTFSGNADGESCLLIQATNLSSCVEGNFCDGLEPCP